MSRKYCSVCREPHSNPETGLCDKHAEEVEKARDEERSRLADEWSFFMDLSEASRWEMVFDFMKSKGWSPF